MTKALELSFEISMLYIYIYIKSVLSLKKKNFHAKPIGRSITEKM